jgi:ferrous iron transport protein A
MNNISLSEMMKGRAYLIAGFHQYDSIYAEKLYKMGFVEGTPVRLAPVEFNDPMVIEIRGSRIALRRQEAKQVYVQEL